MRSLRILVLAILAVVYVSAAPVDEPTLLVHRSANIFESATTASPIKEHVAPGIELTQIQPTKTLGFYKVRTPDGVESWIYQTLVHVIEPDVAPTNVSVTGAASAIDTTWDKPSPIGSILQGPPGKDPCPADGEPGGDDVTNSRKNRKDVPTSYHAITFATLKSLSYPDASTNRNNWTATQTAQIAPFEGVARPGAD